MTLRPWLRKLKSEVAAWMRGALLTGAALAGGLWLAHTAYFRVWPAIVAHPYFQIASVRVRCDSDALGPREIAEKAGLFAGTSLWKIDTEAVEAALAEPGWVHSVRVNRRFPNRVQVEVREREPVAAALGPGGPLLVDESGVVYRPAGERLYPDVPYLTGWQTAPDEKRRAARLRDLLDLVRTVEDAGIHVSQADLDSNGVHWLFPEGQRVSIRLGDPHDLGRVLPRLRDVLATIPASGTAVREIDASYPDRIVLRTWRGGYAALVAEFSQTVPDRRSLVSAPQSREGGDRDRG